MKAAPYWLAGLVAMTVFAETVAARVVLETQELRLAINTNGLVTSLQAKSTGAEYAWIAAPMPLAAVYRRGQMTIESQEDYAENEPPLYRGGECFPASALSQSDDVLTIHFGKANVTARYQVAVTPHYLAFKLLSLAGDPIDRIDLLQLRIKRLPFLGPWIDVAYDDQFGLCLCAGNIQTDAGMNPKPDFVEMRAVATRQVALAGATAILLGCPHPKTQFLGAMEEVEHDFQMPAGARHRRSPIQDYSYLWCSPAPNNIDQYIALAKRAGFRMLMFSYATFSEGAGHFRFNRLFPRGLDDLMAMTDRIRAAGLKVGMHLHYSKADRTDAYVTPIPDDRLHKARTFTLAANVDETADTLTVQENPAGCTRADNRRILKAGAELIAYRDYTTQPPYRFIGCERGHLKTTAAAHRAGEAAGLLDVDDWVRFIRFDQTTDIQDETARRIAEIINGTGPYDLVYFDGAEDVHDPFWYNVGNAQYRVYRLLQPPPPICEGAMSSHFAWHILSRGNAYDVAGQHIKNFCREISCRAAPVRARDFTRINFGWVFQFPKDLGPDELEYVLSRGAAWDCPISLRMTLEEAAANPRAEDCFATIKTWEEARITGKLTDAHHRMLRTLDPREYYYVKVWDAVFKPQWINAWSQNRFSDQEHHLFVNEQGEYELVPVREISDVAGGRVKVFLFQRATQPDDTYALIWAKQAEVNLTLSWAPERVTIMRPFGARLPLGDGQDGVIIKVSSQRYLKLSGASADEAVRVLRRIR